jgi:hypothetical protein
MSNHTFTVTVTEDQQNAIADSVLDWQAWCEGAAQYAINHKAENCRARLIARDEALLTGDTIPRDPVALAAAIMAQPAYQNREQRDAAAGG